MAAERAYVTGNDPQRRVARIYRADGTNSLLAESDALDGEDVLPGFSCPLGSIL